MPDVTVPDSPSGAPIATTGWPTLEPDDCVAPTITPPTTPPATSAVPRATHTSHRRRLRGCLDSPTTAPHPGR